MGRSAGRGGSCPTSKVWVGSAMRSSYESSNWRAYFGPDPGMGMMAVGRKPSASGAKDDSPPFQRWVKVRKRVESPGDGTGLCWTRRCGVPETVGSSNHAYSSLEPWAFLFRPVERN